ncbi:MULTISPECIES: MarR family winged helix-turn-helix transcriptional regulator [Pseudomonas]|uniref:MarR family winged helix-turn-helix transcriptional regulator n=1 Tax=Pseudomonas TaxID=286 RepID=UPI001CD20CE7|nr:MULTISPECIES: MarR family winged helix-turn-helix transcriptional regulator [Pseudomonas]
MLTLKLTAQSKPVYGAIPSSGHSRLGRLDAAIAHVQRIVNDLVKEGMLEFQPNPHHRRAQLVVLTDAGKDAFTLAMKLQAPWINELAQGLEVADIETTYRVLHQLRSKLEQDQRD